MFDVPKIVIAAVLLLLGFGCAKTTDEPAGTNTNWLEVCEGESDCADGQACLCGVCTRACSASAECSAVHADVSCQPLDQAACGSASGASASACLQGCNADDDCTALERGRCTSGLCVPGPADPMTVDCFDPENNVARRLEPGATGCACADQGAAVCAGELTVRCVMRGGQLAWIAEEEGLCSEPPPEPCAASERHATLAACLEDANTCYPQQAGGYCGINILPIGPAQLPDYALMREGAEVVITPAYTECEVNIDCTVVGTSCNGCCEEAAIESALSNTYTDNMTLACADYEGGICDCQPADLVPMCEQSRCVARLRSEVCYAPEVNEENAYELGAVGCACDLFNQAICTGAALVCEDLDGELAWAAVEDGPCGEPTPDPDCAEGEVVPSAAACLEQFMSCHKLADGSYCGEIPIE